MQKRTFVLCLAVAGLTAPAAGTSAAAGELQRVVDQIEAEHRLVPGVALYADGPQEGLPFEGAAGTADLHGSRPLHPDDPFRTASSTKTFTAAAVLRLVEDGRLGLDDAITRYLTPAVASDIPHAERMTVRMLLNHTSGIFSHDEDLRYTAYIATMPTKRWTAEEQIRMSGDNDPYFEPGQGHRYSDTGYVVLGLILQRVTGRDLGTAVRELLDYERLGLGSTWWELYEPPPAGVRQRSHQYQYVYDTTFHDPSFDSYGGGGLISTSEDLARFGRALFEDRVFRRPATLRTMLSGEVPARLIPGVTQVAYAYGMTKYDIDGTICWGHSGHWGSFWMYCPALDAALGGMTNQSADEHDHRTDPLLYQAAVRALKPLPLRQRTARPRLLLRVTPSQVPRRRRVRVRFYVQIGGTPADGATVRFAGRRVKTRADGRATLFVRVRRSGARVARACKTGDGCAVARIRVR